MCGIAGLINRPDLPVEQEQLHRMCAALAHRGPDHHNISIEGTTGLAHTRLAIIDLAGGNQPLAGPRGASLVSNGEIYNFQELWPSISMDQPRTRSDFEPALHLVARHGPKAIDKLRGMYAIAVSLEKGTRVTLSRDPFGIKPLYIARTEHGYAFASEPRAIFAANLVPRVLDKEACSELLDLKYITGTRTPFEGIERVHAGETVSFHNGEIVARERRPWLTAQPSSLPMDEDQLIDRLDSILQESVLFHCRSDVPYGLFLSSGLDSSAIATMMARVSDKPTLCFTAGFDDPEVPDERAGAAAIATHFHAEHFVTSFSESDFWTLLPEIASALDDPTADYAVMPTYKLAKEARRHVKVVLCGEGGDEIFAGYGRYRRMVSPWRMFARPSYQKSVLAGFGVRRQRPLKRTMNGAEIDIESTALQRAQAIDIENWLPNDILLKLDRCLMAHGIEGRTPFLDSEVAAFGFNLPDQMKVRHGLGKWLLRRWAQRYCPPVAAFKRKSGFTPPVRSWIGKRGNEIGELVSLQPGVAEFCDPRAVRTVFEAAAERKAGLAAWTLLFYAVWHSVHICGADASQDVFELLRTG